MVDMRQNFSSLPTNCFQTSLKNKGPNDNSRLSFHQWRAHCLVLWSKHCLWWSNTLNTYKYKENVKNLKTPSGFCFSPSIIMWLFLGIRSDFRSAELIFCHSEEQISSSISHATCALLVSKIISWSIQNEISTYHSATKHQSINTDDWLMCSQLVCCGIMDSLWCTSSCCCCCPYYLNPPPPLPQVPILINTPSFYRLKCQYWSVLIITATL